MNIAISFFQRVGINLKNPAHIKKLLMAVILVTLVIALLIKNFGGTDAVDAAGTVSQDGAPMEQTSLVAGGSGEVGTSGQATDGEIAPAGSSDIYVDVSGAVTKPCVVCLPAGSRVFDAIEAAGGLAEIADTRTINQAAVLNDGEKVYVPTEDEVEAGTVPVNNTGEAAADTGAGTTGGGSGAVSNGKLNINKATAEELQQLSGIGPALSQRIIDYRESHGAFGKIEDIKNVSGIGEKTFEKFGSVKTV
jgi:competence protein ComEA